MQSLAFRATLVRSLWSHMSLVFVLAILLSGCGWAIPSVPVKVYEGSELPKSEISIVLQRSQYAPTRWTIRKYRTYINVLKVDDIEGKNNEYFHVLPGQHKALVSSSGGAGSGIYWNLVPYVYRTINFPTEAGKTYRILSRRINDSSRLPVNMQALWIWVEEIKTGNVVAGEKPPYN